MKMMVMSWLHNHYLADKWMDRPSLTYLISKKHSPLQYSGIISPKQSCYQSVQQTGSLFICLLIAGQKFDTDQEPSAWFP